MHPKYIDDDGLKRCCFCHGRPPMYETTDFTCYLPALRQQYLDAQKKRRLHRFIYFYTLILRNDVLKCICPGIVYQRFLNARRRWNVFKTTRFQNLARFPCHDSFQRKVARVDLFRPRLRNDANQVPIQDVPHLAVLGLQPKMNRW